MNAGVWIDHRKAVVVLATSAGEHTTLIVSAVEKHPERTGDSPLKGRYEAAQVAPDDRQQRALTMHLNVYYDAVIAALRGADALLLFGPGEAKGELRKRLVRLKLGARIRDVLTADKLSDRRIAATVHDYFFTAWAPKGPKTGRPNAGLRGKSPRRAAR
jgi:hypothetical protein